MKRLPGYALALGALACLGLAGCGVSVAAGGENAATHPANGIWVATTVGSENISERRQPAVPPYKAPSNTAPNPLPSGLQATAAQVQASVKGGCWEDSRQGNLYGAYDQLFWWQGGCADTFVQVAVELYPSAGAASRAQDHASPSYLLGRLRSGAVLVDVYGNAPQSVLAQLSGVKGLTSVPGYGS